MHAHKIFEIVTVEFGIVDLLCKRFTPAVHYCQKAKFWHGLQIAARRDYKTGQILGNTNRGRFRVYKTGKRITNRGRDYKTGQKGYKSGQVLKSEQGLQIGAEQY